ncbi:MAG TPA: DUF6348 family protein [Planctomycetaceae bacterium]|nr:DUF6348 family protein [Planctomycetaceae bacterium]
MARRPRDPKGPEICAGNPGQGTTARIQRATGDGHEDVDLVALAAAACEQHGHETINHGSWLEHPASGFAILPQILGVEPMDGGGMRTITTVQVNHPQLIPQGLFEYQHSGDDNTTDAIRKGFSQWVQMDFATLLDALRPEPRVCSMMVMELPEQNGHSARKRRIVLGPTIHYMQEPGTGSVDEEHPFCPCCLLTNSYEAFRPLIEADQLFGLRMFALRDAEANVAADCRVNGEDFEPGAEGLRAYAATWPPAGYEHRKQYVVLQTVED